MKSHKVIGYQGTDGIEMDEDVIVCPTCGHKHVDEQSGDTSIMGELIESGDKLSYFRCHRCRGVLFTIPVEEYNSPVPKDIQQRMKVRKSWDLVKLEEEI